ncbi:MAG: GAF domain-containing protein [Deltaproteobacteria bacterium]|nr:GAF domain-containing protein [Nannocystaceae bacterium]
MPTTIPIPPRGKTDVAHDSPAFGQADLSDCEREQIHLAGSIQPHGALLVLREGDLEVVQASANAAAFLNLRQNIIGVPLRTLCPELPGRIDAHLGTPLETLPVAMRCRVGDPSETFVALLHRPPTGGLVLEFERGGPAVDLADDVDRALRSIVMSASIRPLCDETARIFRGLVGYDRVMVYRFDADGHGEVLSEEKDARLDPLLGNRYPASDIPQIARRLYERNRVRVLVDVEYQPVPVVPRHSPLTGADLDMSLCFTRSMSPIHIQYLKNMGVCATLVVSLLVGGRLWGLVACHHYQPRSIGYELRTGCELLAEVVGTRIAALESFAQSQAELAVRRLEHRMIEAISRDGDWRSALFDSAQSILTPVGATGAALLLDDEVLTTGEVPSTEHLREIGRWLDRKHLRGASPSMFATAALAVDEPAFAPLVGVASGLVAAPVSNEPGDYLVWFRPEQVQTVTWGGNPFKPMIIGNSPSDLSPRRSFAKWHQVVEGTSAPWTAASLATARIIGDTVTDVVVQFRAVRMLIAQHQLDLVRRQVQRSEQAIVLADADGRLVMTSDAFAALLPSGHPSFERLEDLPRLFHRPVEVQRRLQELVQRSQTWRGEAELVGPRGSTRPVLVRADPVFSAPRRVLAFVLFVADLSERKAADAARRRLQERIVESNRFAVGRLESKSDLRYQNLVASILENAQLAALEITDGVELAHMPELVDSVNDSVVRSAQLLQLLLRHSSDPTRS